MKDIFYQRALIINFIKRYETYIVFAAKFGAGLLFYSFVFSIGLYREEIAFLFSPPLSVPFIVLLAASFAFFPATANFLLLALVVTAQLSLSPEIAIIAFLVMLCIVIFYVRLSPQKSYLILAVLVAFYFRIPYAVVLFAGLYLGAAAILPIALGTFTFFTASNLIQIAEYMKPAETIDFMEMPARFVDAYLLTFESLTGDYSWIILTFIFAIVILGIYAVSKLNIDFVKEISLAFGGIVCVMCLVMAALAIDDFTLSAWSAILGTLGSVILVGIIRFFDDLPDYQRTENVRFEDDDNFYYCKIVPKLVVPQTLKTNQPTRKRPTRTDRDRVRTKQETAVRPRPNRQTASLENTGEISFTANIKRGDHTAEGSVTRKIVIPTAVPPRKPNEPPDL